jgi:UDP-3-O-[3-hydroxymyristoyl] glucosamine N-acyltransferase
MADPRFYDNRGPFTLDDLCAAASFARPQGAEGKPRVFDVAGLAAAGPAHLSFYDHVRAHKQFTATAAGWCLVGHKDLRGAPPKSAVLIPCVSVGRAFAAVARLFYPEHELDIRAQETDIHPAARIGSGVVMGPRVVIGPGAEIGDKARIGAHAVIGRGVTIGRGSEIGSHATIAYAHLGDEVVIQPGVVIGGSGFGFSSRPDGHVKLPQLGRVIIQDKVEIGANSAIDRGALGDTVIGEGAKIDNLVQIGHNTRIGRHAMIAGQAGISGSVILGDFVILGGKVGIADHVTIGDGARLAGLSGVSRDLEGGRDYGGIPARPIREWRREAAVIAKLTLKDERRKHE